MKDREIVKVFFRPAAKRPWQIKRAGESVRLTSEQMEQVISLVKADHLLLAETKVEATIYPDRRVTIAYGDFSAPLQREDL